MKETTQEEVRTQFIITNAINGSDELQINQSIDRSDVMGKA